MPPFSADATLNEAAQILRLLHIEELRDLQTRINEAIVAVQAVIADPKTDHRLGKVGRWPGLADPLTSAFNPQHTVCEKVPHKLYMDIGPRPCPYFILVPQQLGLSLLSFFFNFLWRIWDGWNEMD